MKKVELEELVKKLSAERDKAQAECSKLRQIVNETLWMARRYADGRSTYATWDANRAIHIAQELGIEVGPDAAMGGRIYVNDGDFGVWDPDTRRFVKPASASPEPEKDSSPAVEG